MPVTIMDGLTKDLIMKIDIMDKIDTMIQVRKKKITLNNEKLDFDIEIISKELMTYKYFLYYLAVDKNYNPLKTHETINTTILEKDREELGLDLES
jgi:hypothetical protein